VELIPIYRDQGMALGSLIAFAVTAACFDRDGYLLHETDMGTRDDGLANASRTLWCSRSRHRPHRSRWAVAQEYPLSVSASWFLFVQRFCQRVGSTWPLPCVGHIAQVLLDPARFVTVLVGYFASAGTCRIAVEERDHLAIIVQTSWAIFPFLSRTMLRSRHRGPTHATNRRRALRT